MADLRRNGPPTFALVLVAVGVVLLLQNFGVLGWGLWLEVWQFWPTLLIAVGVKLMLGRRLPWLTAAIVAALLAGSLIGAAILASSNRDVAIDRISEPLGGARQLDLWVAFGLGSLAIDSLPRGSSNLVEGSFESKCMAPEISLQRSGGAVALDIEREDLDVESDPGGMVVCVRDSDWRLSLSRAPEITVDLGIAAGSIDLDLADLDVSNLYLDGGAASLDVTMPANAGDVEAVFNTIAASIDVRIPRGVEARIVNDAALSSLDVGSRFPRLSDGVHESPGYRSAENRIHIEFNGAAARVTVR